jgi:hypothetical protein
MKPNSIAYPNLRAEMSRKGITLGDLSEAVNIGRDTLSRKLSRKSPLSLREAFYIQSTVFPGLDIRYLFSDQATSGEQDAS